MLFKRDTNHSWPTQLTLVMQLGLTMAGSIAFCFAVGFYLDRWLHTRGVFITLFTILGVVGGAVTVFRQIQKTFDQRPDNLSDQRPDNSSKLE